MAADLPLSKDKAARGAEATAPDVKRGTMTANRRVEDQDGSVSPGEGAEGRSGIIVKMGGTGRSITLSKTAIGGVSVVGLAVLAWVGYSSYALIGAEFAIESKDQAIADKANQMVEVRSAYETVIDQVHTYQKRFAEVSAQLADSQNRLAALMGENTELKESVLTTTDRLMTVEAAVLDATQQSGAKDAAVDELIDQAFTLTTELIAARRNEQAAQAKASELEGIQDKVLSATSKLSNQEQTLEDLAARNGSLEIRLASAEELLQQAQEQNGDLRQIGERAVALTAQLTEKEQALSDLLDRNMVLKGELTSTQKKLIEVGQERAAETAHAEELTAEIATLQIELEDFTSRAAGLEDGLERLEREMAQVSGEKAKAVEERQKAVAARQTAFDERERAAEEHSTAIAERQSVLGEREQLVGKVAALEKRIASLQRSQQDFLLHVTERTIGTIDEAERTISMTGLGVAWLLDRARHLPVAQGGPFVALNSEMLAASELKHEVSVLDSHMDRWERLQYILRMLPLSAPVDHYRVTSTFGKRKDPVNGRWAMHYGVDMAAPFRSPVLATSAGTVTFAGWKAAYGRTVTIDHGMGIRTRYGHLRSIEVKKGDKVGFREKIGLLGSSGRSTGPHVHYEIIVDKKAVDPASFLKAGKYIFKG
ncbi:MAG: peptidoglycan DD-metalloendopeptidase family protein [Alphaproteobacteria bacterium]|nr:peptidoglycan DD-metalloendopeptidase family protein [Alphaproteobacteria bacterium]